MFLVWTWVFIFSDQNIRHLSEHTNLVEIVDNVTSSEIKTLQSENFHLKKLLARASIPIESITTGVAVNRSRFRVGVVERNVRNIQCKWSPHSSTECEKMIYYILWGGENKKKAQKRHTRWVFWGDSTISRLFFNIPSGLLWQGDAVGNYPSNYTCQKFHGDRCNPNLFLDPNPHDFKWTKPDFLVHGEGPEAFGLQNPFCTDCSGCNSDFAVCELSRSIDIHQTRQDKPFRYGGYFTIEFARDVELQSPNVRTTQEIMASFLRRKYNTDALVEEFGLPVCVLSAGIHDMAIPNITTSKFVANVKWYLGLLKGECSLFIWIANTAPKTDTHHQKKEYIREWNEEVKNVLQTYFSECSVFIDVFNSSINWSYDDNIHMNSTWYASLGEMFGRILIGDAK